MDREEIERRFGSVTPDTDHTATIDMMRSMYYDLAERIVSSTRPGRLQSLALTELEAAAMWTQKAIVEPVTSVTRESYAVMDDLQ